MGFQWDTGALERGLNFTLQTSLGPIVLLGEIAGGGTYDELLDDTCVAPAFGVERRCLTLERLMKVKRGAGRVKDLDAIGQLEALLKERDEERDEERNRRGE